MAEAWQVQGRAGPLRSLDLILNVFERQLEAF